MCHSRDCRVKAACHKRALGCPANCVCLVLWIQLEAECNKFVYLWCVPDLKFDVYGSQIANAILFLYKTSYAVTVCFKGLPNSKISVMESNARFMLLYEMFCIIKTELTKTICLFYVGEFLTLHRFWWLDVIYIYKDQDNKSY